jgi:DNA modification methylase
MLETYYQDEWTKIFHGDCREILPRLEPVDLLLTDPPYGIDYNTQYGRRRMPDGSWKPPQNMPPVTGDKDQFDPAFLLNGGRILILWGANHYAHKLPHAGQWLIWDKRCAIVPQRAQSDCEMAWHSRRGPDRILYHLWDGMVKASERGVARQHPTQKPLAVMHWCLSLAPEARTVIDPFMGSGTTLRAAKDMGIKSIGIEIEEEYCRIAVERLRQESLLGLIETLEEARR